MTRSLSASERTSVRLLANMVSLSAMRATRRRS